MDTPLLVALVSGAAAVVGGLVALWGTLSKSKGDAKSALDERIDARVEKQLESAWKEIDGLKSQNSTQADQMTSLKVQNKAQAKQIQELQDHAAISERREALIYQHTRALRNHILNQLPPPPPAMPQDLLEWFEKFQSGEQ